jgi:hypothetical protein
MPKTNASEQKKAVTKKGAKQETVQGKGVEYESNAGFKAESKFN